jgi:rhodanese-related sulfurtransferase
LLPAVTLAAGGWRSPGIAPGDLHARLASPEPPLVVDVRSPSEYADAHIPGAISIPAPLVEKRLDDFRNAPGAVIYCNEGMFTRVAEQTLLRTGVRDFVRLEGGLFAWRRAGLPEEKGTAGPAPAVESAP